jgi:hypothetical protein
MTLVEVILNQNYFQYNDELYIQNDGLAMGAPTSSIFAKYLFNILSIITVNILQNTTLQICG